MSNSYTKAAFTVRMKPEEAALIELAERAIDFFETCEDAELLFRCAKSALPCGFQYANDCDKLRCDEFGGGCVVITETGITYSSTGRILDRALLRHQDEGADGFVLTIRDREHGLSFWNHATGFGRLAAATVFSEAEAQRFDKPIADDEPEWMACPAPLSP